MNRIITPIVIALIAAGAFFVEQPYATIAWALVAVAAAVWISSEVVRCRHR